MTDYIDREEAIDAVLDVFYDTTDIDLSGVKFEAAILKIQAADVEPVKRGRWDGDTCTSCNLPWNYNMTQNAQDWGYFDPMPDYCPQLRGTDG